MITVDQLRAMALGRPNAANTNSVAVALNAYGQKVGLDRPHRLAHYLAQLLHESASFRYDREVWGPTPAQKRYEGRTDLGNTQKGDGKRFMGRTAGMLTGRDNYRSFTKWARSVDPSAPDFEKQPELVNTDPWEGLVPLWYWDSRNINRHADQNNIEMVTRVINGGLNGFDDRVRYYGRAALVLLGYGTSKAEIKRFQSEHPAAGPADGIIGPSTRMALHEALAGKNPYEQRVPVPVDRPTVPVQVEDEVTKKTSLWGWITTLSGGGGAGGAMLLGLQWQTVAVLAAVALVGVVILVVLGPQIVRSIKRIRSEIEAGT